MKQAVNKFVRSLGGTTNYQGRTNTMFINDPLKAEIEIKIIAKFGYKLNFKLATNAG